MLTIRRTRTAWSEVLRCIYDHYYLFLNCPTWFALWFVRQYKYFFIFSCTNILHQCACCANDFVDFVYHYTSFVTVSFVKLLCAGLQSFFSFVSSQAHTHFLKEEIICCQKVFAFELQVEICKLSTWFVFCFLHPRNPYHIYPIYPMQSTY